ncbi:hypothetical protein VTJ49DRAFT_1578 [Mycothermus thermophilus]|uniref:Major facilitator superfamily transporter n=1 Tax=Humicola insolens TaxID=85995 RepID=A0ABR3VQM4_HUMIN
MPRPRQRSSSDAVRSAHHSPSAADARRSIRPLLLLVALINLAWSLYQLPVSRVVESRLCRAHYATSDDSSVEGAGAGDGSIPEEMCKIEAVQRPLGRVQGVMDMLWVAGDFFMTIPLVSLADHFGYRPVLCLTLVPRVFVLAWTFAVGYFDNILPVKAIVAAPAFSFLGGDCVVNSIVYAIASELAGDDHVLRATFFGWINATSSVFALQLGPALASATMTVLLWLPLWIGIALLALAVPVISALPLPRTHSHHEGQHHANDEDRESTAPLMSASTTMKPVTLKHRAVARLRAVVGLVANPTRNFALLLAVFFLASLASSDTKMLPLYVSTRYRWTFAQVGYLLSGKALFNFVFLTVLSPARRARL